MRTTNKEAKILNELINFGAKVDITNNYGNTPLHMIVNQSHSLFDILIKAPKININVQDLNGDTILHKITARKGKVHNTAKMVEKVLKLGADCNIANNAGW